MLSTWINLLAVPITPVSFSTSGRLIPEFAPGFFLKHFVKDMKIALTEANMSNLNLDVLSQVLANYELLQAEGCGDLGTQALIKYYEEEMDV